MNYSICDTVEFTYDELIVIGTIVGFGSGYFRMVTKSGTNDYFLDKMKAVHLYSCPIRELVLHYLRSGDAKFQYLYEQYGYKG